MIDQFKAAFFEEAAELLENLETSLLDLENDLNNRELLESVFRVMHTLKGSAGMVELNAVEAFAHELETAFDKVRDGKLQMTDQLTSLTLRAKDQIQNMISESGDYDQREVQEIIRLVKNMVGEKTEKSDVSEEKTDVKESQEKAVKKLFAIHFKPAETLLINGSNPFFLLEELQELGECTIIMNASRVPDLESIAPENCYLEWQIIICTAKTPTIWKISHLCCGRLRKLNVRELADDTGYDLEEIQKDLKDLTTDDTFLGDAELQSVFDRHKKQQPEPPQPTEPKNNTKN
ncbi:MAG: Hpt domain-containing protein [Calditrichia bacterium]